MAAPVAASFNWYTTLAPSFLTACFLCAGWLVVERFARHRERRTDMRAMISSFSQAVSDISQAAITFYQMPGSGADAISMATTIRAKIQALPLAIEALQAAGVALHVDDHIKMFRQAVTGEPFETPGRAVFPSGAPRFQAITSSGQLLVGAVQQAIYEEFLGLSKKAGRRSRKGLKKVPAAVTIRPL